MSLASSVKNARFVPVLVPTTHNYRALPVALAMHLLLIAILLFSANSKIQQPAPRLIVQAELWQALPDSSGDSTNINSVVSTPVPVVAIATPPVVADTTVIATQQIKRPITNIKPKVISKVPALLPLHPLKIEKSVPEPKIKPKLTHAVILPSTTVKFVESDKENHAIQAEKNAKDAARGKELARLNALLNNATPVLSTPQGLGVGWGAKLKACVQPHLRYNDTTGANPRVEFVVKLNAIGSPKSIEISKSSHNDAYDAAVERALRRCDPFPLPDSGSYPTTGITVGYRLND